eukprot:SAG22_NODE_12_length_33707_cov_70.427118_5_plen_609_part_00
MAAQGQAEGRAGLPQRQQQGGAPGGPGPRLPRRDKQKGGRGPRSGSRLPKASHRICSRGPQDFEAAAAGAALDVVLVGTSIQPQARAASPGPQAAPGHGAQEEAGARQPAHREASAAPAVAAAPGAEEHEVEHVAAWRAGECACKVRCGTIAAGHLHAPAGGGPAGAQRTLPAPPGLLVAPSKAAWLQPRTVLPAGSPQHSRGELPTIPEEIWVLVLEHCSEAPTLCRTAAVSWAFREMLLADRSGSLWLSGASRSTRLAADGRSAALKPLAPPARLPAHQQAIFSAVTGELQARVAALHTRYDSALKGLTPSVSAAWKSARKAGALALTDPSWPSELSGGGGGGGGSSSEEPGQLAQWRCPPVCCIVVACAALVGVDGSSTHQQQGVDPTRPGSAEEELSQQCRRVAGRDANTPDIAGTQATGPQPAAPSAAEVAEQLQRFQSLLQRLAAEANSSPNASNPLLDSAQPLLQLFASLLDKERFAARATAADMEGGGLTGDDAAVAEVAAAAALRRRWDDLSALLRSVRFCTKELEKFPLMLALAHQLLLLHHNLAVHYNFGFDGGCDSSSHTDRGGQREQQLGGSPLAQIPERIRQLESTIGAYRRFA